MEKLLELVEGSVQRRLTQFFAGQFRLLFGKVFLERDGLLKMKCLEVTVLAIDLKPVERLRHRVHGRLAMPHSFFQISEVFALDSFVTGVVCCHGADLLISSHCLR